MDDLPIANGRYMQKEGLNLEFKSALKGIPESIWDTYSSFANTFGGRIVLGIKDGTDEVEGVPKADLRIQELWNSLNNPQIVNENILSPNDIRSMEVDGKTIIIMDVPRADRFLRPIYHRKMETGTFKRNGEGDFRCRIPEISAMLRDRSETSFDSSVIDDLYFEDMDMDTFHMFRNMLSNHNPQHSWNKVDDGQFSEMIGATRHRDGRRSLTVAGLLMFGKEYLIYREFPDFKLDYREYGEESDWVFRLVTGDGTWEGNVFNFFQRISSRLSSDINRPLTIDNSMRRIDDTELHRAVRECLLNALIHADYHGDLTVLVEKRLDRLRVSNSGLFRLPISVAERGGESDPRNKTIAKMFSSIGLVERAGVGVNFIMETWKDGFSVSPLIREDSTKDRVCIDLPYTDIEDHDSINKEIIAMMARNPKVTYKELSEHLGISVATVANRIKILATRKIVERVDGTRGYWKIDTTYGEYFLETGTFKFYPDQ